jgi:hypothetical protein
MRLSMMSALILVAVLISDVNAGEIGEVELIDGSVICGEIVSSEGGIYTLKSDTISTVKVEKSKIRAIRFKPSCEPNAKKRDTMPNSSGAQIHLLQQLIMGDQEILQMILSLLNDPDIQGIVEDPSIIEAVNRGDIEALSSNPKFMKLLDNPAIQELTKKLEE